MDNGKKIEWVLRIAVAGEFLGHGLLAYGGKPDWILWTSKLTGFDTPTATTLMTMIGLFDVFIAPLLPPWATESCKDL